MSKAQYRKLAEQVASQEEGFRGNIEGIANMGSSLTNIGAQTGAPGAINQAEIPMAAALANMRATAQTASQERQNYTETQRKAMPSFVKSYRNYLKWRYPGTYAGGSSGTAASGQYLPTYEIPPIGLPAAPEFRR